MKKIRILPSKVHGKGVYADEDIQKGELIQHLKGEIVRQTSWHDDHPASMKTWFGLRKRTWIDPGKGPFSYLNHSCEPNGAMSGPKTLVALKKIKRGEEITVDYSLTDPDPNWSMHCKCGSRTCRIHIGPIYTLPQRVFNNHMPFVPRYFQKLYKNRALVLKKYHGHQ